MSDFESSVMSMGANLKEMRQARGLRLVDVASMAGIPRLKVIHVEAGRPGVAISSYARVSAALGAQLQVVPAQRPTLEEIGALIGDDRG
jgi:transcriptional regulator with XRE-family HTH domain